MRAPLLLVLATTLAGCAGDASPLVSGHFGHDHRDGRPAEHVLDVPAEVATLHVHLRFGPAEPGARCDGEHDARVRVIAPGGEEEARLGHAAPDCTAALRLALAPEPGRWRVLFEGDGPVLGAADFSGVGPRRGIRAPG